MAAKKTFSTWLTNKYLLIIRNEENFAEKITFSFNYARVFLLLAMIGLIILGVAIYLVTVALEQWLDPRHAQMVADRQVVELSIKLDSLENEVRNKDTYIENVRKVIAGEEIEQVQEGNVETELKPADLSQQLQPVDSQFRASFENSELSDLSVLPINVSSSITNSESCTYLVPLMDTM